MNRVAKLIATIGQEMEAEPAARSPLNAEHLRMTEALLFAASEPLDVKALATSLPDGADVLGPSLANFNRFMKAGV